MTVALLGKKGWEFGTEPEATLDTVNGKSVLADIYVLADPHYSGRASVPVLWDKKQRTIVNNESSEIIRMLNSARSTPSPMCAPITIHSSCAAKSIGSTTSFTRPSTTAFIAQASRPPRPLMKKPRVRCSPRSISWKSGFHSSGIWSASSSTEADWRLFTTLIRFDAVYYSHFKCNLRRIVDYPNLWNYLRDLYQVPGVAETVSLDHIKRHYYGSHRNVNPTGIVPIGPLLISPCRTTAPFRLILN